jgi:hypothetical protein
MDVGPAPPAAAPRCRGARASRLARLLLCSLAKIRLAVLLLPMSACIIPVGPDFRDPSGAPNSPPFVISTDPPEGSMERGGVTKTFSVTPSDNNLEDNLYLRWIVDFPRPDLTFFLPIDTIEASEDGSPLTRPQSKPFECNRFSRVITSHQIMVVISDREFIEGAIDPRDVEGDTEPEIVTWTWDTSDCSPQP